MPIKKSQYNLFTTFQQRLI